MIVWLIVAFVLLASSAQGHGDAAWIMQNPKTEHCCGPRDCKQVQAVFTPQGWAFENPFTGEAVVLEEGRKYEPRVSFYPSIDDHFWACFYLHIRSKPVRCFFTPTTGI